MVTRVWALVLSQRYLYVPGKSTPPTDGLWNSIVNLFSMLKFVSNEWDRGQEQQSGDRAVAEGDTSQMSK